MLSILFVRSLVSRLLSDISVLRVLYMHLYLLEFSPVCNFQYRAMLYYFQTLERTRLFIYCFVDAVTRVQFSRFYKIRSFSFFFFFTSRSFTHAIAFLLVARPHTRDIRRVLIMLPDHWPLSSPFHEIPARGGTTYYVPGSSVPSHTIFHGDRLH